MIEKLSSLIEELHILMRQSSMQQAHDINELLMQLEQIRINLEKLTQ